MGKLFGVTQSVVKRIETIVISNGDNAFYILMADNSI